MADQSTILMRRMGVKTERKGLFGHELRFAPNGECSDSDALYAVRKDGSNARSVCVDKKGFFADGQVPSDDELLFAVRRLPFYFDMAISAGKDADGFEWYFKVGGMLEITKPEIFAGKFRGEGDRLDVMTFESRLGTIPSTVLHDQITVDVLGVMSLEDKGADEKYADIRKHLEAWRSTNEAFITSAIDSAFTSFFGVDAVARLDVSTFHAQSPMCEKAIAEDEKKRIAAIEVKKAEEALRREEEEKRKESERLKRDNDARREEELSQKKHELELAELEAQKAKLKGGDVSSAFAAFETITNVLENAVQGSGSGSFVDVLKCVNRGESGLRLLALTRDKKRAGGVTLEKSAPSFQTRGFSFTTKKTPSLHHGDSLSSTIINERRSGYLMIMNISERNEIIPLLPNADFPDVRIACGERVLVGDDASAYIPNIWENASSGTDHLVAMVSDVPLLSAPLPPLGEALSASAVSELISKLETLDADAWAADIISFTILP